MLFKDIKIQIFRFRKSLSQSNLRNLFFGSAIKINFFLIDFVFLCGLSNKNKNSSFAPILIYNSEIWGVYAKIRPLQYFMYMYGHTIKTCCCC